MKFKKIYESDKCSVCGEYGDNYVDGRCLCDDCLEDFENNDFDGFHVTDDDYDKGDYAFEESKLGNALGSVGRAIGNAAGDAVTGAGKLAWRGTKAVGRATGNYLKKDAKKTWDKWTGNNKGKMKKGSDVVMKDDKGNKVVGQVVSYDNVDKIYSIKDTSKKKAAESTIVKIRHMETISESRCNEGLTDSLKKGWNKVKDGARSMKKKLGDMFNGPFRKGDRVEMTGDNGETVQGTITGFDYGDRSYTVLISNNYN